MFGLSAHLCECRRAQSPLNHIFFFSSFQCTETTTRWPRQTHHRHARAQKTRNLCAAFIIIFIFFLFAVDVDFILLRSCICDYGTALIYDVGCAFMHCIPSAHFPTTPSCPSPPPVVLRVWNLLRVASVSGCFTITFFSLFDSMRWNGSMCACDVLKEGLPVCVHARGTRS